jgi:hypothetical protein
VVRLGMECYRLTCSLGSMLEQDCHKKTAQKAGSCVGRACRIEDPILRWSSLFGDSPARLNLVHARGLLKGPMDVILKR